MHPVTEESITLTKAEPHKPLLHNENKPKGRPSDCAETSKEIAKISQRVQHQLKKIYESHSICLEDIDFTTKRRLGHGAFCDVHEVSMNQRTLAMKRISPKAMAHSSPKEVARNTSDLAREAALLATTAHKNIVKMHGISPGSLLEDNPAVVLDEDDNNKGFFILLDRLETTLDQKIMEWNKEERMSKVPAWRIRRKNQQRLDKLMDRLEVALDMARGLQYLHEKDIVHCDIKPENVGFDENGVLKLFDFGLAMKLKHKKDTIQGTAGTRAYMAPEIHLNQPYGTKVDVFAFAITLWQLCALSSRPIFEMSLDISGSSSFMVDGVRSLKDRPAMKEWWPLELQDLLERCWSCKANERPECDEIVLAIENILKGRR